MVKHCVLSMKGMQKRYGDMVALDNVDFDLYAGEVHCLVGENGAGKSTLIKILSGAEKPSSGVIWLFGQEYSFLTPDLALRLGIATIYQDVELVSSLTVADNIFLGHEKTKGKGIVDFRAQALAARQLLDSLKIDISVDEVVANLSAAEQQMLQIVKALHLNAKILIMDEPTVSLGIEETNALMALIERLKQQGVSIIYISHYLDEVFRIGDRVTVLKDGVKVGTYQIDEIDYQGLADRMVGRERSAFFQRSRVPIGEVLLEVRNLHAPPLVYNVSFALRRGEILGFGGLVGAGRTELMQVLFGAEPVVSGEIRLHGTPVRFRSPKDAIDCGFAMVPEDRKQDGLFLSRTLRENIAVIRNEHYGSFLLDRGGEESLVSQLVNRLGIVTESLEKLVGYLSGGNQQKTVIARWFQSKADVFIFDEPTKGVDIGAKRQIYELMVELVRAGKGILMVSSDMTELLSMSDRIAIMRDNTIVDIVEADAVTEQALVERFLGLVSKRGDRK